MKFLLRVVVYVLMPLCLIAWIYLKPFLTDGLIVGSDWIFPYTQDQMIQFGSDAWHLWNYREIPTGTQSPHHNIYLFAMGIGVLGKLGVDGVFFQRILIFVITSGVYLSFYICFARRLGNESAAMLGGLVYVFSPVVFNYFIMGWWFVLMFMAIVPWILMWSWNYWHSGKIKYLFGSGLLFVIAFWQAQALIWVPLIFFITWTFSLKEINPRILFVRGILAGIIVGGIVGIGHGSWMYAVGMEREDYIIAATSNNDVVRFSQLSQLYNQLRGWGALYNEQFEFSFRREWEWLSYLFIAIFIASLTVVNDKIRKRWLTIGLMLLLISPLFYLGRNFIATLPLSNIIRDTSRFSIFTQLALAIGVTIFLSEIRNKFIISGVVVLILFTTHPFWLGRLQTPEHVAYGNAQFNKDQHPRILVVNNSEIEGLMKKENSQRGLLFPTGGYLSTSRPSPFRGTFAEIGDHDASFSPYATGIFISDKSNPRIKDFAEKYFLAAHGSTSDFFELSRVYGIDRIYMRDSLVSNFDKTQQFSPFLDQCQATGNVSSPWSITHVCNIDKPFPIVYLAQINGDESRDNIQVNHYCQTSSDTPCVVNDLSFIRSYKDSLTELNRMDNSKNKILVMNTTWHPGWKLIDGDQKELDYQHVIVNDLVNGWELPEVVPSEMTIVFMPDVVYQRLVRLSMVGLLITLLMWVGLVIKEKCL